MNKTSISWTDFSSNPLYVVDKETGQRGWFCEKVSPGCAHCYASALNVRRGTGHAYLSENRDKVEWRLNEREMEAILKRRKPTRIFMCDMLDLFHDDVPDAFIDRVFATMALAREHTFQLLTKRPERMRMYLNDIERPAKIAKAWGPLEDKLTNEEWLVAGAGAVRLTGAPGRVYGTCATLVGLEVSELASVTGRYLLRCVTWLRVWTAGLRFREGITAALPVLRSLRPCWLRGWWGLVESVVSGSPRRCETSRACGRFAAVPARRPISRSISTRSGIATGAAWSFRVIMRRRTVQRIAELRRIVLGKSYPRRVRIWSRCPPGSVARMLARLF